MSEKKAVMVVAFEGFRDEEYFEPKVILEKAGFKITTASSSLGNATGKYGAKTKVDLLLKDLKASDYTAVIFVGGPGSYQYFDNPAALDLAKEAYNSGKVTAAICAASSILANAGVLKGKTATAFPDQGSNLKAKGANYTASGIEVDGKVITADGPAHAKAFGEAIVKALE